MNKYITYKGLPFAFDDIPIRNNIFSRSLKKWDLYFDSFFDIISNIEIDSYCRLTIFNWRKIYIKSTDEKQYSEVFDLKLLDLWLVLNLEYVEKDKLLKLCVCTYETNLYLDILFIDANYSFMIEE